MLHNTYQYSGGEDVSTDNEVEMLRHAGHQVSFDLLNNEEILDYSFLQKIGLSFSAAWSLKNYQLMRRKIEEIKPNLIHVQNFFPLLSPSIHAAARSLDLPTVQHLRNFRLGCLSPYFYRRNQVCEVCVGRNPWRGIVHRCYRNSFPASISLWGMISYNRLRGTWAHEVDAYITPSQFAVRKLIQIGIPANRLYVKPNIVADPLISSKVLPLPEKPHFLYAGRLSPEKGIMTLLKAWHMLKQPDWKLTVMGDGDQRKEVEQFIHNTELTNVELKGGRPASEVLDMMQKSTGVVVPSQWYEVFGRVVIEAYACGRSVIASDLGALPELVEENETGFLVPHDNVAAWMERLRWCGNHQIEMTQLGSKARQTYVQNYTPQINYKQMKSIYDRVLRS